MRIHFSTDDGEVINVIKLPIKGSGEKKRKLEIKTAYEIQNLIEMRYEVKDE